MAISDTDLITSSEAKRALICALCGASARITRELGVREAVETGADLFEQLSARGEARGLRRGCVRGLPGREGLAEGLRGRASDGRVRADEVRQQPQSYSSPMSPLGRPGRAPQASINFPHPAGSTLVNFLRVSPPGSSNAQSSPRSWSRAVWRQRPRPRRAVRSRRLPPLSR
jgi:hypothetical protein